ncbi:isopentenyl transferase family protein [Erwinia tracheiphila]|uniref:isopentenyl transferase family protein n=1 Tax=Erwinia tracheiphila TaxID=65700 RepID=UPI001F1AECF8|nr:isopentenyl transferase family protein [Erwinia tracheiphila]UIA94724.1 isopentenyl transferase family protein [Erwinia tracheiphila]
MSAKIYLLWGATTTGKTSDSTVLAKEKNLPVIALDRFQGYNEIATGSGSPTKDELQSTERVYVTPSSSMNRGVASSRECHIILKNTAASLLSAHSGAIIEGGSVSLLKEMVNDDYWSGFHWIIKKFTLPYKEVYLSKAEKRIYDMFHPQDGRMSILDEVSRFFRENNTVTPLEDIDGYRVIISYLRDNQIEFDDINKLTLKDEKTLIKMISDEYYQHALWQEREFPCIPSSWKWDALLS